MKENITKTYKKSSARLGKTINLDAKEIAKNIYIDTNIEYLAKTSVFMSLKDHKPNFMSSHPCRLINPCKSELGKISKIILEKTNDTLIKSLNLDQ